MTSSCLTLSSPLEGEQTPASRAEARGAEADEDGVVGGLFHAIILEFFILPYKKYCSEKSPHGTRYGLPPLRIPAPPQGGSLRGLP